VTKYEKKNLLFKPVKSDKKTKDSILFILFKLFLATAPLYLIYNHII